MSLFKANYCHIFFKMLVNQMPSTKDPPNINYQEIIFWLRNERKLVIATLNFKNENINEHRRYLFSQVICGKYTDNYNSDDTTLDDDEDKKNTSTVIKRINNRHAELTEALIKKTQY